METYRSELKYLIPLSDIPLLVHRLDALLQRDAHASSEGYFVKSLYFDDPYDSAVREKMDGAAYRYKYRLRYYNHDTSYIVLEKKSKILDQGHKVSVRLSLSEARAVAKGDFEILKDHPDSFIQCFVADAQQKALRPRLVVAYDRIPYLFEAGDVRITIDTAIRTTHDTERFFEPELTTVLQMNAVGLLEVKYTGFFPDFLRHVLVLPQATRIANSKYVSGCLTSAR